MRFSLKTMLAASAFIAVSVAGLHYANLPWAAFFYTAAFLSVLTGIVGSLVCSWPTRAFWIGFAVFGGGYFWLALIHEARVEVQGFGVQVPEPDLGTTHLLIWADRLLRSERSGTPGFQRRSLSGPRSTREYFVQVGHGIFTMLLALIGGALGKAFAQHGRATSCA
jgi:hypothetical protein